MDGQYRNLAGISATGEMLYYYGRSSGIGLENNSQDVRAQGIIFTTLT